MYKNNKLFFIQKLHMSIRDFSNPLPQREKQKSIWDPAWSLKSQTIEKRNTWFETRTLTSGFILVKWGTKILQNIKMKKDAKTICIRQIIYRGTFCGSETIILRTVPSRRRSCLNRHLTV